ncbi:MAG TPA: small ribosomal subunit biogenesis GTPase RsgA [Candidatus Tenderia sp.]|nr:small ribosomal subunit biogenesis GTPase RsgA [Candidatus Tenderia sp.]
MAKKRASHRRPARDSAPSKETAGHPGLVITRFGAKLDVEDEDGEVRRCTSRRRLDDIVCGDRVIWQPTMENKGVVIERLPRDTLLSRPDDRGRVKSVAANLNQIIVTSVVKGSLTEHYRLNNALIDHYLVAAEHQGITPVLVINKADLLHPDDLKQLEIDTAPYRDIGYTVLHTSTKIEKELARLEQQLANHSSVFVGESGVGKSSLINALLPQAAIRTGEISAHSGKGKHTTTTTVLYHLPCGGDLIDSPGVREFGLVITAQAEIAHGFKEFRRYLGQCRFNNCTHLHEPNCAIIKAVEAGEIQTARYQSYQRMMMPKAD